MVSFLRGDPPVNPILVVTQFMCSARWLCSSSRRCTKEGLGLAGMGCMLSGQEMKSEEEVAVDRLHCC
jgi:hypothetical protein